MTYRTLLIIELLNGKLSVYTMQCEVQKWLEILTDSSVSANSFQIKVHLLFLFKLLVFQGRNTSQYS